MPAFHPPTSSPPPEELPRLRSEYFALLHTVTSLAQDFRLDEMSLLSLTHFQALGKRIRDLQRPPAPHAAPPAPRPSGPAPSPPPPLTANPYTLLETLRAIITSHDPANTPGATTAAILNVVATHLAECAATCSEFATLLDQPLPPPNPTHALNSPFVNN